MKQQAEKMDQIIARFVLPFLGLVVCMAVFPESRAFAQATTSERMFRIKVVDQATSRGIPRVRLTTTNDLELWTDSAGVAAFYHPDLMGKAVYFSLETYGYTRPPDGSGKPGATLVTTAGTSVVLTMDRTFAAQRLYRITGEGVRIDSQLLGDAVPLTQDASNSPVMGQDTVGTAIYKGKLYWHWGDTNIPRHILGNFGTTCATSQLPGAGGLDPEEGVSLTYFRQANGEVKRMVNVSGLVWIGDMRTVRDSVGAERLVAHYTQGGFTVTETGLIVFNDGTQTFDRLVSMSLSPVVPLGQHTYFYNDKGTTYSYGGAPAPTVRCPGDYASIQNPANYEAFTCLKPGSVYDGSAGQLDRDTSGSLVWGWKKNTSPLGINEINTLLSRKFVTEDEMNYRLTDIGTGKKLLAHGSAASWNAYRQRWICVYTQNWLSGPSSFLGELWYAEADTPLGPWIYSEKIVTHALPDKTYSWYNPALHPEFEKENGRVVFLEGTYTEWLSNTDIPTPTYNYNQDMYKLELDDPRIFLPVPVYRTTVFPKGYWTKANLPGPNTERSIAFFAPDRPRKDTVAVYQYRDVAHGTTVLSTDATLPAPLDGRAVAFYAYARSADIPSSASLGILPLYEFIHGTTQDRIYTTELSVEQAGYARLANPVCLVWKKQTRFEPHRY